MTDTFIERTFSNAHQVAWVYLSVVISVLIFGVWLGRRRLWVAIAIAIPILLWAMVMIPGIVTIRPYVRRFACIANLEEIQTEGARWLKTNSTGSVNVPPISQLLPKHFSPSSCPSGGTYRWDTSLGVPTCSHSNLGHRLNP